MLDDTYRLRPIPIASVATSILQGSSGSLNFLAWDSLVPVNHTETKLSATQTAELMVCHVRIDAEFKLKLIPETLVYTLVYTMQTAQGSKHTPVVLHSLALSPGGKLP